MWVRKLPEEIRKEREKERRNPKWPALLAGVIFISLSIVTKLGFSKFAHPAIDPQSWDVFLSKGLPLSFFVSAIIFTVLYLFQLRRKEHMDRAVTILICTKCYKIKNYDDEFNCSCGGEFVNINEMTWIESKS